MTLDHFEIKQHHNLSKEQVNTCIKAFDMQNDMEIYKIEF